MIASGWMIAMVDCLECPRIDSLPYCRLENTKLLPYYQFAVIGDSRPKILQMTGFNLATFGRETIDWPVYFY